MSVTTLGPTARGGLASILVPIAGGPNSDAVVDVAVDLARHWGASLQLLTVVSRSSDDAAWLQADARLHNYAGDIDGLPVDVGVCSRDDVVAAITERAQAHDLVVVGESDRSLFRRLFAGTIPERLAERSETPIFVVERGRRGNRDAR